jgi:hypothetical protein
MSDDAEKSSVKSQSTDVVVQTLEDDEYFPDGGLRAWLVVVGCFVINAVAVGFW